jgi:hypothetical protein
MKWEDASIQDVTRWHPDSEVSDEGGILGEILGGKG